MSNKIVSRVLILCALFFVHSKVSHGETTSWHHFIEEYSRLTGSSSRSLSAGAIKPREHYRIKAFQPGEPILITLGPDHLPGEQHIELSMLNGASWIPADAAVVRQQTDQMVISNGIGDEGFFRFQWTQKGLDSQETLDSGFLVVSSNWKRALFALSRQHREKIETNPDPQLIRSSLAVAHWDHFMANLSPANDLTGHLMALLARSFQAQAAYEKGEYPDLVIGLNKLRLKRFPGDLIEEFVLYVPDNYDESRSWPLFVHPDNRRWAARDHYEDRSGMLDLWWHTVTNTNVDWKSYQAFRIIVDDKLNIDDDSIYIDGHCGDGYAAMSLALNYPEHWAECSVALTSTYRYMAGNAINMPLVFARGGHPEESASGYYRFALKCFQYVGCARMKFGDKRTADLVRGTELPNSIRTRKPLRVSHTIESYSNPKVYWVEILGRDDENLIGTVEACIKDQSVVIDTRNVAGYRLYLSQAPLDANQPVEIIENNQNLGLVKDPVFTKFPDGYHDAKYTKNRQIHGPIADAFTDPFVVVYGVNGLSRLGASVVRKVAENLAQGAPCLSETDVSDSILSTHNLVLVGLNDSNKLINQLSGSLPLAIEKKQIRTSSQKIIRGNDLGYACVYPNPVFPEKYIVVYTATSAAALEHLLKAHDELCKQAASDVAVFQLTGNGELKWLIREKFDLYWNWHRAYDCVVGNVKSTHPRWQWKQWMARVVKDQIESEVVIYEDNLIDHDSLGPGQITYRDLFNAFRNDWFIKIKISGKQLRQLVTSPLSGSTNLELVAPTFEGISFWASSGTSDEHDLSISEISDTRFYHVALPERGLYTGRLGMAIQDYEIVQQIHLMFLVKDYLQNRAFIDFDGQLDDLKPNLF